MGSKIVFSDIGSNKTADVKENTVPHSAQGRVLSKPLVQRISLMLILGETIRAVTNAN